MRSAEPCRKRSYPGEFFKAAETIKNFDSDLVIPITWNFERRDGGRSGRSYKAVKGEWVPQTGWLEIK